MPERQMTESRTRAHRNAVGPGHGQIQSVGQFITYMTALAMFCLCLRQCFASLSRVLGPLLAAGNKLETERRADMKVGSLYRRNRHLLRVHAAYLGLSHKPFRLGTSTWFFHVLLGRSLQVLEDSPIAQYSAPATGGSDLRRRRFWQEKRPLSPRLNRRAY